jgi:hypothetical protein
MTDDPGSEEGAEEAIEDLEAPAAEWADVAGGIACKLPTIGCTNPTCTAQTFCSGNTHQQCTGVTCGMTVVRVQ